jgi:competence protein ComEC
MARTRLSVPWADLIRHCAAADIVIADRRLPRACQARWLTLDKRELARRGGAAISLANGHVSRSRDPRDEHPWIRATIRLHFSKHGSSSTGARPMQPPSNH